MSRCSTGLSFFTDTDCHFSGHGSKDILLSFSYKKMLRLSSVIFI